MSNDDDCSLVQAVIIAGIQPQQFALGRTWRITIFIGFHITFFCFRYIGVGLNLPFFIIPFSDGGSGLPLPPWSRLILNCKYFSVKWQMIEAFFSFNRSLVELVYNYECLSFTRFFVCVLLSIGLWSFKLWLYW